MTTNPSDSRTHPGTDIAHYQMVARDAAEAGDPRAWPLLYDMVRELHKAGVAYMRKLHLRDGVFSLYSKGLEVVIYVCLDMECSDYAGYLVRYNRQVHQVCEKCKKPMAIFVSVFPWDIILVGMAP